ncbi:unnamed protein product, partial [Anisakis simplex]|uniref:Zinc finger protein 596 (inferred by orthology to a human protein) n=1 Tax=Anisakis simplex TaxID=6269 RepID=A0A0M3J510_ANISI
MTGEDEGMILHEDDGLIENNFVDASCLLTDDYVVGGSNDDCNNDLQLSFSSILDEADAKLTAVVESVASSAASNDNDNTLSPVKALINDNNNQENNNNGSNGCLMVNQMYEEIEGDANGTVVAMVMILRCLKIVRCEYCGVILKHPSKIQAHMRTHTGEKPFECNICGMRFTQRTPMRMHVRRHIGDTPFKCSWGCGKSFVSNAIKNAHELRIHMGEKRLLFLLFGTFFDSFCLLITKQGPPCPHLKPPRRSIPLRFQTSAEELNLFESTSGTSAEPLIGEHEVDDEEEEDGVHFNDNNFAIVHFEPPLGDIIKQQQIANKRLDEIIESVASGMNVDLPSLRSSRGKRHIAANETTSKTRRSALVAQCEECGLILKHPSKIQAHLRTHTGEKPFECGVCGWRFSTANPLRVHLRRAHTGEKPYECTWDCGRRFVTASARNEHERIVHAGIK